VDVLDSLGSNRQNITKNVEKWQLDESGRKRIFSGRNKETRQVKHQEHDRSLEDMHVDGIHAEVLTTLTYDTFLATNDLSFVNFYAPWCIWCQRLHPTWETFAEEVAEKKLPIGVGQVDCVANSALCSAQKIQAFPTLRWFNKGTAVSPDYKGDRTTTALTVYSKRLMEKEERYQNWEEKRKLNEEKGENDKEGKKKPAVQNPHGNTGSPDHPMCQVSGYLLVNRVPGNFHIEAGSNNHNLNPAGTNLSHVVNHLSFGEPVGRETRKIKKFLGGVDQGFKQFTPLDEKTYVNEKGHTAFHHYLKIVNTKFNVKDKSNTATGMLEKYQFLSASQEVNYLTSDIPEARFSYDLSPMAVAVDRKRETSWYEFLTSLFAIIGGTFTTLGIIDGIVYKVFKTKKN